MKKTTPKKASAGKPTRPAAAARATARTPKAAARPSSIGSDSLTRVVEQLDQRLAETARLFEAAKRSFEEAARARVAASSLSDRKLQRDLTEHGMEMRLLTARRTELLWARRLLQPEKA